MWWIWIFQRDANSFPPDRPKSQKSYLNRVDWNPAVLLLRPLITKIYILYFTANQYGFFSYVLQWRRDVCKYPENPYFHVGLSAANLIIISRYNNII